jgi:phospholipid transport system substrate-binding protein
MVSRRSAFSAAVALLVLFSVAPARSALAAPNAQEVVEQASSQAIAVLKQRKQDFQQNPQHIFQFVEQYLLPYFDFDFVSRMVLGKAWRQASPQERERFKKVFEETLIRNYASAMLQYSDQKIDFLPFNQEAGAQRAVVKTEIETASGGKPASVDYTLHKVDDDWKVIDVTIEGVSMVVNYRSQFAEEIRRLNGLTPLIDKLEERNKQGIVNEPGKPAKPSNKP